MVKKHNETSHQIFANLPLISFFGIITFLYSAYMITYLTKLITDDYDYDKAKALPTDAQYATLFLTMRTITFYTESMVSKLQSEEIELTSQEQKGTIYLVVSHFFIILLLISIFRTIFTAPGSVPLDWSNATEAELYDAAENEKIILTENYKKRKLVAEQTRGQGQHGTTSPGKEGRSQSPGVGEDTPMGQGDQGGQGEALPRSPEDFLDDPQALEQLNQMAFLNAMKKENKRFCGHCQMFKPPRTHHCRQCNSCILKMDHHCPWVGNCVGFRNYKYFFNMVFYGVLLLWFMVATYTELVSDTLFNMDVKVGLAFLIFFTYALNAVLALVITGFFCFHCWLVIRGKTTLEQVEEKESGNYNLGFWRNAKSTLGSNVWAWLLPIAPHLEDNGLFSKTHAK